MGGMILVREWRRNKIRVPVIIVSARDELPNRIKGLDTGADDYVTKPFEVRELLARIRAVCRRGGAERRDVTLTNGVLTLDPATRKVTVRKAEGEINASLTATEFSVLAALLKYPGRIMSAQDLESSIYDYTHDGSSNSVEVLIHSLRGKIGKEQIKNVRGAGWKVLEEK